jgi:hypothetical protein
LRGKDRREWQNDGTYIVIRYINNSLMSHVMKQSKGKANPPAVIAMLKKKLG